MIKNKFIKVQETSKEVSFFIDTIVLAQMAIEMFENQ
jgi:hypothetical protein